MKLVLEPRYLFDGSVHAVTKHAINLADHDVSSHDSANHTSHPDISAAPAISASTTSQPNIPALAPNPAADQILFIDTRVADWQTLAAGVGKDVQVVLIDPNKDGIQQVTDALQGRHNLESIDFLTYGQSGEIQLGSNAVTTASLTADAAEVASWGDHLAPGADIQFYGCDVGEGSAGLAFVDTVHTLTGAEVGASTDATGDAALGGNWTLERTTGALAVGLPFSEASLADYHHVLDINPVPTVTFSNVPADLLLGSTFTETVNFSNTAATAVGYGPFIDVFVPTDAAQSATLTSATYLGQAVTVDAVTLSTTVAGHTGTLGALHPLAVGTDGNPIFVAAPSGYQAGDTMYVLQLPFGSYTPGEPAAAIDLNFTMDTKTELSSAHSSQPLNISAIGGFQYGLDPLNDPSTDPSIRGTILTPGVTSAADGLVVAASQVVLIEASATTDLHEDETATGPDYPFNYVLTVTPAPVTQTDAIQSLDFTFNLPSQVQYNNGTIAISGPGGSTGTATFHAGTDGPNSPGGTVTINFTSLTTDGSDTPTVIKIPVFVPQNDASGNPILNATTGAPVTISTSPIYSYTGSWDATSASLDHDGGVATGFSGNSTGGVDDSSFVAKSLAIQVTDDADGSILPGQIVTDTIHFQVSDYFSLNNLNIANIMSDGTSLLIPGDVGYVAPVLSITRAGVTTGNISFGDAAASGSDATVNGQSVAASGTAADWSYTRDDTGSTSSPGATTIGFNVGGLLEAQFGGTLGSVLQGASGSTQGTITFVTKILDKYTNTNSEDSIRERDDITDIVPTTGTSAAVVTVAGGIATPTGGTVTDGSSVTDAVAQGSLVLTVVAVNGSSADTTDIHPGDTVTYALTYSLTTGDYGDLNLTAFLPLPVFNAADPNADGGSVATYTADNTDAFPTVGQYKLVNPGTGMTVVSNATNSTANSIDFNLGNRDDPTNAPGQQVVIYFSVIASTAPYADALQLTAQAQSLYTNAGGATAAAASIRPVLLNEPELKVKTGIVSLVADNGTTDKGTYSVDPNGSGQTTSPAPSGVAGSSPFEPAGTATGTDPFTGNGTPTSENDLNVTGADANDTARVVSTVTNAGHATAYDAVVSGTLPTGYSTADVHNFGIYNAAGVQIDTGVTAAEYFGAGGVQLTASIAGQASIYVVYDLTLQSNTPTGNTLTPSSAIVNWTNVPTGGTNFVTSGSPTGESATALTDNATIGTTAPSIGKTVTQGSDTSGAGSTDPVALSSVVLGETVTYTLVITLPEGTTANGGSQVTATDVLPAGMTFTGTPTISYDSHLTLTGGPTSGGTITMSQNGQTLTFDLGTAITNNSVDATDTITITYQANITATATPSNGHTYTNNASFQYSGTSVATTSATVTQVDPNVVETVAVTDSVTHNPVTNVYSGETLDYSVNLDNTGTAPANELVYYVEVPTADLKTITALTPTNGTLTDTHTTVMNGGVTYEVLEITDTALAVSATDAFKFTAVVQDDLTAGTSVLVGTPNDDTLTPGAATANGTYNSLPTGVGTGHNYTGSATDTVSVATFAPTLKIIGESNNTSGGGTGLYTTAVSSVDATIGDIVRYTAYVQVPEGQNTSSLVVNLPAGLDFQDSTNDTITVLLVSPGGVLSSTNVDPSAQASYTGTYNPATALATVVLDSSHINVVGSTITFDLGTLTDNESSPGADYVIVQFNAIVANTTTIGTGSGQTSSLAANVTSGGQTSSNATVTVEEPDLTLTKTVASITNSGGVATIVLTETITNTGDSTAYNVLLDDPEATSNVGNISGLSISGASTLTVTQGNGTTDLKAGGSLAAGASETFTYTETSLNTTSAIPDATATVTYTSLSTATGDTLSGTTTGGSGTATGSRDSSTGTTGLNHYEATATIGFGVVSGRAWNDIGPNNTTFGETGSHDTGLSGVTVSGLFTGTGGTVTETTTTAGDGTYSILAPDGSVTVKLPASGSGGLASNETLVYNDGGTVVSPASAIVAASSALAAANVNFSYQTPDTAPVIGGWGSGSVSATTPAVTYTEGGSPVVLATGASITDTEIDETSQDYGSSKLTIERYNSSGVAAPNASDVFVGTGAGASQLVLSGSTVTYGGATVGTYTETGGVLQITFAGGTTAATVNNVLNAVGYQGSATNTIGTGIKIGAKLDDHNTSNLQGTGGDMTSAVKFVTLNETPATGAVTFTEPNDTPATGAAISIDGAVTVSSSDSFSSVTVQISGLVSGEDVLTASPPAGFTMSFTGGLLTLSKAGATAAQIQTALQSVQYYDSSDTPTTSARTLTITVNDSTTGAATSTTVGLTVVAVNDSPILNTGISVSIASSTEDVLGMPTMGTVGTLVSSLVGTSLNVTDPDGAGVSNGGTPAPATGIAITAINTTYGNWYYSTDGGNSWTEMTGISTSNALRLTATAEIYFQPTVANLNGTINNAITFHAWDQFGGGASGSTVDLTSVGTLGSGTNTAGSAYSSATDSLPVVITAVNDAPVATGTSTLSSAQTVSALFTSNFDDSADAQPTLPGGSTANTLAGIAISGDTANPTTEGVWQYSTNGGTSWTTITASSVSETGALVLSNTAELRFDPVVGYSGTPGGLVAHLIDSSTGNVSTTGVTGAALQGSTSVFTGIDIASHDGTPTPISTFAVPLSTTVTVATPTVTFTEPNDTAASGNAVTLDGSVSLPTATYSSATIQFTAGGQSGEDILTFTASGSTGNILASGGTGGTPLTLTSSGNSATTAQWQAALDTIQYYDSSDTPVTTARTVQISAVDTTGENTTVAIATVDVVSVNDSPILNTGISVSVASSTEDVLSVPTTGTVGTLVSSLVGTSLNVTDPDGAGVSNGGTPAPAPGIAITAINTTYGNWYYSTDGGNSWTEMTGISTSNALRLTATAEIYFQPTVANLNGTIANAITFHAWDQFGGGASGSTVDLTSVGTLGSGTNTAGSAYSSATDSLPVVITAVNDAPVATGTSTLSSAQTVSALFTSNFDDSADAQPTLPGGSTANTLAGIAISGDTANPTTEGVWQYSTNGGTSWTTITASSVSETGALVLSNTAELRFDPVVGYSGTPGGLVAHLIDSSTGNVSTTGVTGAALQGSTSVFTGIDIASHDGTPTPISTFAVPLSTTVTVATPTVTFTEPNDTAASGNAVTLDGSVSLPTATYSSATIQFTAGGQSGEDILTFTASGSTGNIVASGGTGGTPLTLSSSGNSATTAQWQAALDTIQYYDSSDTPFSSDRTVTISAVDSTGENTTAAIVTVHVTPVNDSPILTPNSSLTLANSTQDSLGVPVGAVGTLVSSLVTGNVTDTDNANLSNTGTVPTGALGIAINQADTTEGNWYYSTDNGAHWTEFASSGMTAISSTNALHLLADGSTRIYFQPTVAGANGVIETALTYHAWDQFDGATNGSLSALPTDSAFGAGVNSNASAYSSAVQVLPVTITAVGGTTYTDPNDTSASAAAVNVDAGAVLTATSDTFTSATVTITNFQNGEDHLVFTPTGATPDITGNVVGGTLTLTASGGGASAAEFQAALQAVQYYDSSDTPISTARTITLTAHDSTTSSDVAVAIVTQTVVPANDSPILTPNASLTLANSTQDALGAPTGAVGTLVSSLVTGNVTDTDNANLSNTSTVPAGALGIAISQADTTEGNWWYSTDNGAHWTEFASSGMTAISSGNALHLLADSSTRIYFQPDVSGANGVIATALTYHAWDQFDTSSNPADNGLLSALPSSLGTGVNTAGSAYSSSVQVLPVTIIATGGAVFTDPNDTSASAAAVVVDPVAVLTATADTFTSATVTITNFQSGEDHLVFTPTGATPDITGNVVGGVLTLTASGGGASAAEFQAAIQAVQYYDSSDTPITAARGVTITAHDSTAGMDVAVASTTISVVAGNDSPILNDNAVSLVTSTEDNGAPQGAVGTLISSLTGGGNVTDTDNANLSNTSTVPAGALGIAITAADTTEGNWYYSTNGGTTWTEFASSSMTPISATNALHLAADPSTRIYFQPTANWNGEIDNGLTFRGWDKFDGATNGSLSALPTDSAFGAGVNTDASAYSAATQTLPIIAIAVNDAPIASGSATLTTVEDTTNPPGDTVAHLFGADFNDSIDQQMTSINPTGSVANTLAGVAITGNTATAGQGVYQYSTDNGAHWTDIPTTGLSDSSALILPSSADIRFLPVANFNGIPGSLTTRLIDSSTTIVTGSTTGFDLSTGSTVFTSVDVSGVNNGGITAVSAATVPLTASVTAVNDAPIASGTAALTTTEDTTNSPGTTIGSVLGQTTVNYSDATDTVTTAVSGGSVGTPAAAIAVTGNTATPDQGVYQYSTDGGTTWVTIPSTGLGATNAIVIPVTADIRFLPVANFNGMPGQLTAHISDGTALPATGAEDISAVIGGTGGFSTGTIVISTTVVAVNDAPVASGSASLTPVNEDTANPPGDTVGHLFGGNFSDTVDQQQTTANPTGSVANTLAGVAITGNAATPNEGVYQYSTDGGTTWVTIPATGLSDGNSIVLPVSAEVRFLPVANFNGIPGDLTVRLIDSSTTVVTGTTTGLDLSTGSTAFTGVDVSGANNGGITAVSAAPVDLTTSVIAVNDAPIATGSATLAPTTEDTLNPPGDTIADLFGGNFSDQADLQKTPTNPTGSIANTLAGIVVTGNAANSAQGVYEYSTDNGATWISIPSSGLGDNSAIILPASAELRFLPAIGFSGTPGALTTRLIDTSSGALTGAETGVSLTAVGGITPYSADNVILTTNVIEAASVPILTPTPPPSIFSFDTDTSPDAVDKLASTSGGEGTAYTDDFLSRPIIPQVSLIGSVGNKFVIAEQHSVIAIPSNLFEDSYPGAQLEFDARSPSGGALPGWLQFDARNLTFSGTPPASQHGAVDVLIVARDQFGNEATASFRILVGRDDEALQSLMGAPKKSATEPTPIVAPGTPENGNDNGQRHRGQKSTSRDMRYADTGHPVPSGTIDGLFASLAAQSANGHHLGRSAFSAQLRDAGAMGRLSQARHLLETIAKADTVKPAA